MTPKDRIYKVLSGEKVDRPPVFSATQTGTIELMQSSGAYWPDANYNPELMANLAVAGHTVAGLEAIRIPFCLTVLAEALGCEVEKGREDRQPAIAKTLLSQGKEPDVDRFLERGRVPAILETIRIIKAMGYDVPLIVGFEGPTTLAGHMVGVERLCIMMIKNPDEALKYIRWAEDACVAYAKAVIKEGADVIAPADPTASPSVLSPRMFDRFSKSPLKAIAAVHPRSILHVCGNATPILAHMAECGFAGLSIEEKVDLAKAKEVLGGRKVALVGNIPSAGVLLSGSEDDVYAEAKKAIAAGVDVLAPSCGIAPRTPTRNLRAMVRAVTS
ncbi:MAG: methylcobamide:CoM methyltransferase MtaA [Candidatus Methanosuratincola sp.]